MEELNPNTGAAHQRLTSGHLLRSSVMSVFLAERERFVRIAAGMGVSGLDVEDVLQDVSVQVLRNTSRFKQEQDCLHWLIRVTTNRCLLDHRRHRTFGRWASEILQQRRKPAASSVETSVILAKELEAVRRSPQQLDDSLLVPLVLAYFCELNSSQIGRVLELNPSTVRSRLHKARMVLANALIRKGHKP